MTFTVPEFKMLTYEKVNHLIQSLQTTIATRPFSDEFAGVYQADNQNLVQFYNGTGILLPPGAQLGTLSTVSFHPKYYPFQATGLTYSVKIDEETFNSLGGEKNNIKGIGRHGAIEFFRGDGGLLLAYWYMTGWFLVLESPGTIASIDLEMANHIPLGEVDETKSRSSGKPTYKIAEANYFLFDLADGKCRNIEVALTQLSEMLLINQNRFDFSEKSLNVLDQALYWNMNRVDAYALSRPLTAYVGECIRKAKGESWYWTEYVSLMDDVENEIQIGGDVHKSIIDTDHGWSVAHIYGNAMR